MLRDKSDNVKRAESILAGAAPTQGELFALSQVLKVEEKFGVARRILEQMLSRSGGPIIAGETAQSRSATRAVHLQGSRSSR
jgi:hypothetical protein